MPEPERLVVRDGGVWGAGVRVALGGLAFLACVLGLALRTTEATPADLGLPAAALASIWLLWVLVHAVASVVNRARDRRAIRRLFGGEIWAVWRHTAEGWRSHVEAEARAMAPRGRAPFTGALFTSILGAGVAGALLAVAHFAPPDPQYREILRIVAAGVFLLLLGVGLLQPVAARARAAAYRRRALQVAEPRVWFGPRGAYEESLGLTPLDPLEKVSDDTRDRGVITFTVSSRVLRRSGEIFSTESYSVQVSIAVPAQHRAEAAALAERYRSLIGA